MPPIVIVLPIIGAVTFDLAGTLLTLATNLLLGFVSSALFGKPAAPVSNAPKPSLSQTVKGSTEARKVIYGEILTGGVLVYAETSDGASGKVNQLLHTVIAYAGHECNAITDVYFDDKISTDPQFLSSSGLPLFVVNKHLGSDSQTVDSTLQAAVPAWDATHRLQGICYLYVQLEWQFNPVTWRAGIPNVRARIQGKKLYDPRDGVTRYASNPALCVRDWLTSSYGFDASDAEIDDDLISTAANICDESVGGQARYSCDGVISLDESPLSVLTDLLTSMAGACVYSQGKFRVYAGAAGTKSVTIDRSILRGPIQVDPRMARQDLFNAVRGTFTDPTKDWQAADFPPVVNPTYTAQDSEQIFRDITLRFTVDSTAVRPQRIAKIHLEKSRQQIKATIPCNFSALEIAPWDVIGITEPLLGWNDKDFRVLSWTLAEGGGVDLTVQEEAAASYNWSGGDATTIDPAPDTTLNDPFVTVAPGAPTIMETLVETRSGAGVASQATIMWAETGDAFAERYRVRYKLHAASTYIIAGETVDTSFIIQDLPAGNYDFGVAAINTFGTTSSYSTTTKQLLGLTAPPASVSNFNLVIRNGQANLSWDRATDLDVIHGGSVAIRWSPATSGATWASSIDMASVAGGALGASVAAATGSYLARFKDSVGNFSTTDAIVSTTLPDILGMNVVSTITESPSFSGTKTNTSKVGSVLQLDGASLTGTYAFATALDLGSVLTSRVTANLAAVVFDVGNNIDGRLDNIDTWVSIDGVTGLEATAALEVRTTPDDPAGSPTWSAWIPLVIGDYVCRAYQFRASLTTTDLSFNVQISTLAVTVDMPDRTESFDVTTSSGADTSLTWTPAFKAVPAVGYTIDNMAAGDIIAVTTRTASTLAFSIKNAGSRVVRTVSGIVRGY